MIWTKCDFWVDGYVYSGSYCSIIKMNFQTKIVTMIFGLNHATNEYKMILYAFYVFNKHPKSRVAPYNFFVFTKYQNPAS